MTPFNTLIVGAPGTGKTEKLASIRNYFPKTHISEVMPFYEFNEKYRLGRIKPMMYLVDEVSSASEMNILMQANISFIAVTNNEDLANYEYPERKGDLAILKM